MDHSSHSRIFLDTCYSEGLLDVEYKMENLDEIKKYNILKPTNSKVIAITSSNETQVSTESTINNAGGIFTNNLINSIETIGNYNIKYSIKLLENNENVKQNIVICSTYLFDKEPILF